MKAMLKLPRPSIPQLKRKKTALLFRLAEILLTVKIPQLINSSHIALILLHSAKFLYNFDLSECYRVKFDLMYLL